MAGGHLSEAEACLGQLGEQEDDSSVERSLLGRSIAHSVLSIARNMETVAARGSEPLADSALHVAAYVLATAADLLDVGSAVLMLVSHAKGSRWTTAPELARTALDASTGLEHYAVAQAIIALRIELPV
jgi:hypothetical protein